MDKYYIVLAEYLDGDGEVEDTEEIVTTESYETAKETASGAAQEALDFGYPVRVTVRHYENDSIREVEEVFGTLNCRCASCGKEGKYTLNEEETSKLIRYREQGRSMGYIQDIFPKIPSRIRSGAIDLMSGGFCVSPECCG